MLSVDGQEVARTTAKMTVPAAFTASESFDVGIDLGSTVSRDYFERRPFKFEGKIQTVKVELNLEAGVVRDRRRIFPALERRCGIPMN